MSTIVDGQEEDGGRAAEISQLIRRLHPGDKVIFETGGTGRIEQPHVVTKVVVEEEEYRVYTEGP
jgi:preprotein translocase subunit YajC